MTFILQYKWFIVGAILGVIQLSITIIRGKRVVNAPVLFLIFGAIIGSIFYGNVLGIFLLAFFIKWVGARAVLIAALITQIAVIIVFRLDWMPYLWLNLLGCGLVMLLAIGIQTVVPPKKA